MVGSAVFGALLVAVAAAIVSALDRRQYINVYVAAFLVWTAFGFFRGVRRWQYTSWLLDEFGLRIRRGWLFKSETLVPRSRVQHLDIDRGPLERRYGLATLTLYTAGTGHSMIVHSGLAEADAMALRDALIPKDVDVDGI
jgi:membrane protein YdbS with pleckstrin-like domain